MTTDASRARAGLHATTSQPPDRVLARNLKVLGAELTDLATVSATVRAQLPLMKVTVHGECRGVHRSDDRLYFDLATVNGEDIAVLGVRIGPRTASTVDGFLQRQGKSLTAHTRSGNEITVEGTVELDTESSTLYLNLTRIGPFFSTPGPLARRQREYCDELQRSGVHPARLRLDGPGIQHDVDSRQLAWPESLRHVTVIGSKMSDSISDLRRVLKYAERSGATVVAYKDVSVQGRQARTKLIKALDSVTPGSTDLVMVARGGGSWQSLTPFDSLGVAQAILRCPVPVFTGIGHAPTTTLADRVADASFITPTALATAFRNQLRTKSARKRSERKLSAAVPVPHQPRSRSYAERQYEQLVQETTRLREQLTTEVSRRTGVEREHAAALDECQRFRSHYTEYMRRTGLARVRRRAAWVASSWALTAAAITTTELTLVGTGTLSGIIVLAVGLCCIAVAGYTWRGRHRATTALRRPSRPERLPANDEAWRQAHENVATPREFRLLWMQPSRQR